MTTCPTCGAGATEAMHTSPAGVSWMAYTHAQPPLDELAAWCDEHGRRFGVGRTESFTRHNGEFEAGIHGTLSDLEDRYAYGDTIQEAAANLLTQLKDTP